MDFVRRGFLPILVCAVVCSCAPKQDPATAPLEGETKKARRLPKPKAEGKAERMEVPVAFWAGGESTSQVDAVKADEEGHLLLDLGEDWTPYILSEASSPDEEPKPNQYRPTYLALARGEFPKDRHGYRAKKDQYLELYGILPTLSLLRDRFTEVSNTVLEIREYRESLMQLRADSPPDSTRAIDSHLSLLRDIEGTLMIWMGSDAHPMMWSPPGLTEKLSALSGAVNSGDARPTESMYAVFDHVTSRYLGERARFQRLMSLNLERPRGEE